MALKNRLMLHILCPKCNHSLQISSKQLKRKRYNVTCSQCKLQFKAGTIINKQAVPKTQETRVPEEKFPEIPTLIKVRTQTSKKPEALNAPPVETYAWQTTKSTHHSARWLTGIILGIALFAYQVYYFKGYALSQSPQIRPWLHIISSKLNYPPASFS
ncbi:hypothetical protein bplSymb_SCF00402P005 [Bathymodiolus platifrons methanotrophic gill symbiont]|uniref:hypothetical protein n=1 Tax=Bathymodiolus platifrons methanotrophic gill symbiont TaxID=113268 RepID=UPI000B42109E|nr:hypothetical protein [Bathymodiolus platifrons methanotrophic gill symbiont]GAW85164.1 hypothetical protein bplSymb_SCF00402P005 [Bathymodiolus platifrons methanotrophic gill symbiont]GFO77508.1 hypothetical protein BPLS_P5987 [Bathymodiolus platifrons methanotrophic gill symbiont]